MSAIRPRPCRAGRVPRPAGGAQERGVALITALLVVALSAVVAVTVAARQELDIRRTANVLAADQAFAYALGVEDWARLILERDKEDSDYDHLGEGWATIIPPIVVEGGNLSGHIEDLQGRFNISNLITKDGDSALHIQQFRRLLDVLDLDPDLVYALLDWMDLNIETRFPEGAEDEEYLGGELPYRAANQPLVSISELRLVKGFDAEAMEKLRPHVAVLQPDTLVNINTATVPVLRSLANGVTQADAESLVEGRGEEGYKTVDEFMQQSALAGRQVNQGLLTQESRYFLLHSEVNIGNARTRLYSEIKRDEQGTTVLMRTQGTE